MRLHSDIITADTIREQIKATATGTYAEVLTPHRSTKRKSAFELRYWAFPGKDRTGRTRRNPQDVQGDEKAATYNEWGDLLSALYDIDPDMVVASYYKGRDHFHEMTRFQFPTTESAD